MDDQSKKLVHEFLWFQKFISQNNFETQIEIENDELSVYHDTELIRWNATEANRIRTQVPDIKLSYKYVRNVLKKRFELVEPVFATKAYSIWYAEKIIKGRFELGETAIAKDVSYSQKYQKFLAK